MNLLAMMSYDVGRMRVVFVRRRAGAILTVSRLTSGELELIGASPNTLRSIVYLITC